MESPPCSGAQWQAMPGANHEIELKTDWLCLDCELMPWSVKAQELLRLQYAPVGTAGINVLDAAGLSLTTASPRVDGLNDLTMRTEARLDALRKVSRRISTLLLAGHFSQ